MNSNKYFYLLSMIIIQIAIVATTKTEPKPLIVSPDSENEATNSKDQVAEIRKSMKNEEKVPVASIQQLHETSGMREKIHKAVKEDKYENGKDVPDNIDVQLHARKDAPSESVGSTGDGNIESAIGETTTNTDVKEDVVKKDAVKEDVSDPIDSHNKEAVDQDVGSARGQRNKIFLRIPSFTQVTIPILQKLRKDFWLTLFAAPKA